MKSTIFSLLPLASLAIAESVCTLKTVTHTEYEKVYETAKAVEVKAVLSSCSRRTVTATTYEKVYVTVTPGTVEDARTTSTLDVTSTSTLYLQTTITVHPSSSVVISSGSLSYPTISVQSQEPTDSVMYTAVPLSEVANSSSSSPSYPTISGQEQEPTYSATYTAVSLSEVADPTSTYEVPAESTSSMSAPTMKVAQVDSATSTAANTGNATYYGGNLAGGMCSFTGYTIPSGIYGTALSDSNWASAANCGACLQVTGPSGTKIKAMVVDQCPGCGTNHLDLFPDAFSALADPIKGVIFVSWEIVPCGITSPIVLKNKEGTSKYWFSMQVMNSNEPVSKLEVSTDGGSSWMSTTRKDYNYFENPSGFGTDSVDVKVTSFNGGSIIVKGVSIAASSTTTGGSNFA